MQEAGLAAHLRQESQPQSQDRVQTAGHSLRGAQEQNKEGGVLQGALEVPLHTFSDF